MSRRTRAVKRSVPADPRYDSQTVSKFVNNLMVEGKKSVAEGLFYKAMDLIEERTGQPGVAVFKQAVNNAKPTLEVKSRRVGGASLQVPVEVRPERRTALAMRWLISLTAGTKAGTSWRGWSRARLPAAMDYRRLRCSSSMTMRLISFAGPANCRRVRFPNSLNLAGAT